MSTAAKIEAALSLRFIDLKNAMQVARWKLKWALQGGSTLWPARPLTDKRSEEDMKRYRAIEIQRKHVRGSNRRLVNMVSWRYQRARRKAAR